MKPAPFKYVAPRSVKEAVAVLAEHGDDAKPLAGGQSLMPAINLRLARPSVLVDLNGIPELQYLRRDGGTLAIGAMTRQRVVERAGVSGADVIAEAVRHIGHVAIRNRGTIGGSLAHADPAAEWPAVALALDGVCDVVGPGGGRTVSAEDLFVGPLTTSLHPGELLTEIRVTLPGPGSGSAFLELARRHGDFALAGVAVVVSLTPQGVVRHARIGLMGVGSKPVRARAAEDALTGQSPTERQLAAAAAAVDGAIDPMSDIHASGSYRRHIAQVLTRRALTIACARAKGQAVNGQA